jgi:regulator of protease activity HflC (stomatin/prohibitin superfamily)
MEALIGLILGLFEGSSVVGTAVATFAALSVGLPIVLGILRFFGIYAVVEEGTAHVYTLFGKVVLVLSEPGINILWLKIGPRAFLVRLLGELKVVDARLDQQYLRSQPVNSEEGAPMGIGVWYEMRVSDPVSYLFKNADPKGSLAANVSNATIRSLSNLPLDTMLQDRHAMSQSVRDEVSPRSQEWGYKLGSVYIRKVHFRDVQMIRQIEQKVVNRLRQVTASILQDGANQVRIISSTADRQAAVEFAKAKALRPTIVGAALQEISKDPDVLKAMFDALELEKLIEGNGNVTLIPGTTGQSGDLLKQLLTAG